MVFLAWWCQAVPLTANLFCNVTVIKRYYCFYKNLLTKSLKSLIAWSLFS